MVVSFLSHFSVGFEMVLVMESPVPLYFVATFLSLIMGSLHPLFWMTFA